MNQSRPDANTIEEGINQQTINKDVKKQIRKEDDLENSPLQQRNNDNKEIENKEEDEVEEIVQKGFFASADNVVDEINKIQYSVQKEKKEQKTLRQEFLMKEKEMEETKNNNNILERNKVVNDYINVLENKQKQKQKDIKDEEDDEFAKAETSYKQLNKKDYNNLSGTILKSKLFYAPKEIIMKNESNANFSLTFKHPETLYILENKYQKRLQTLRKLYKANENIPSLKNMNEEKERSLSSSSKSPFTSKKAQLFKLFQKEKLALQCLNDSKNPYSKLWIDKILMLRYKSKIKVKGFINAIPQLRLQKIRDVPFPKVIINN